MGVLDLDNVLLVLALRLPELLHLLDQLHLLRLEVGHLRALQAQLRQQRALLALLLLELAVQREDLFRLLPVLALEFLQALLDLPVVHRQHRYLALLFLRVLLRFLTCHLLLVQLRLKRLDLLHVGLLVVQQAGLFRFLVGAHFLVVPVLDRLQLALDRGVLLLQVGDPVRQAAVVLEDLLFPRYGPFQIATERVQLPFEFLLQLRHLDARVAFLGKTGL